jgi:exonuclease SbcD
VGLVRILHTSDWHLGRLFHRASLLDEQAAAMSRIVEVVRTEGVELVLIAGDLYDRSIPPSDAVELFDHTLAQLHASGATVVAISGNHDSAVRVGFGDQLLGRVGVTLRGDLARTGQAVQVPAVDGGPAVRVYPVPYLDPLATAHHARRDHDPDADAGTDADGNPAARTRFTHHDAMSWAMGRVRADLARVGSARSVVVAHTFLTGGEPSASERELSLGHVDQVGMSVFDGVDYVALGHLHRRQAFAGGRVATTARRCATPSPNRRTRPRCAWSTWRDSSIACRQIDLGVGRCARSRPGSSSCSPIRAGRCRGCLGPGGADRPPAALQAMRRLQERFPHAVELSHEPGALPVGEARVRCQGAHADPLDLSVEFLRDRRGIDLDDAEHQLLADAVAAVRTGVPT